MPSRIFDKSQSILPAFVKTTADRLRPFYENEFYILTLTIINAGLPDEALAKSGISAKNLKRPGVQKVLKLARKKQVDAVVVYKLDRICRRDEVRDRVCRDPGYSYPGSLGKWYFSMDLSVFFAIY